MNTSLVFTFTAFACMLVLVIHPIVLPGGGLVVSAVLSGLLALLSPLSERLWEVIKRLAANVGEEPHPCLDEDVYSAIGVLPVGFVVVVLAVILGLVGTLPVEWASVIVLSVLAGQCVVAVLLAFFLLKVSRELDIVLYSGGGRR